MAQNLTSKLWNSFRSQHAYAIFPYTSLNHQSLTLLHTHGFLSAVALGNSTIPLREPHNSIWAWLTPNAMVDVKNVSKPSRRVFATHKELKRLLAGKYVERLQWLGLKQPLELGQVVAIRTPVGVMELRDAVKRYLEGEVLFTMK